MASGDSTTSMVPWSIECIKQDHGKSFLSSIPKYDGFCFVPSHLNYERVIENFYNRYSPFVHEPKAGYPTQTLVFLNHVFAEQLDLGLDYIKILLMHPTQMLPILCLVSTERNTGKTTFLNFLKAIFVGVLDGIITQNVDGLHQAGRRARRHRTARRPGPRRLPGLRRLERPGGAEARLQRRSTPTSRPRADASQPRRRRRARGRRRSMASSWRLPACGGDLLKPDVVFFGENVPPARRTASTWSSPPAPCSCSARR